MNTTSMAVSILVPVVVAGMTALAAWFTRRADRAAERTDAAAELTSKNLATMSESLTLIDDLKHDFWDLEEYVEMVRRKWRELQEELRERGAIRRVDDLPPVPASRVRRREREQRDR